ncbi:WLM-domain-containing protein [Meredithblackwellia eburnea MCA 4105]
MASSDIQLTITHSKASYTFTLSQSSTLDDLQTLIETRFSVPRSAQKVVFKGGVRIPPSPTTPSETFLASLLPSTSSQPADQPYKAVLIGASSASLLAQSSLESERQRKHSAFEYHQSKPQYKVRNTSVGQIDETEQYKFYELKPFGPEVPQLDKREAMLKRLSEDPAVRDVMKRHKFVVGTLTELHPHADSHLLGLNRNAGQEICLRLLTNALDGTRSYLDVRRVLLHELTHNVWSPHDDNFKTLNSQLNREVTEYEAANGLRSISDQMPAWEPTHTEEEEAARNGRTLAEAETGADKKRERMQFGLEDEIDFRREKMREAAERRLRDK